MPPPWVTDVSEGGRSGQGTDAALATTAEQALIPKHRGLRDADAPIIARVREMTDADPRLSRWGTLLRIPDDELPGAGEPDNKRRRVLRRMALAAPRTKQRTLKN